MTVQSALTATERRTVLLLAVGAMCERLACDADTAEEHIDRYEVRIRGDDHDVTLTVADQVLVRCTRAWLAELDGDLP